MIARRSLVFVVSDFISTPGWHRQLAQLSRRHEVLAVRLYDPLEQELPDLGLLVVQDSETGERLFVDTHDKGFRKRFAAAAAAERAEVATDISRTGARHVVLGTNGDWLRTFASFLLQKGDRR